MKRLGLSLAAVVFTALLTPPALANPPAQVEVLEDEEDELFERPAKRPPQNANINTQHNKQTVNIHVHTQDEPEEPQPGPEANPPGQPIPKTKPKPKAQPKPPKFHRCGYRSSRWYNRRNYVAQGDFMVQVQGGLHDGGGFFGMGIEGMLADEVSVRFGGYLNRFDGDDLIGGGANWDFFDSPHWGTGGVNRNTLERGMGHLLDLSLAFHPLRKSRLDLSPSIGLSHFGYDLRYPTFRNRGGSGLMRLGLAANYHFRWLYVGMDFGWYPVELFRYRIEDDGDARGVEIERRLDPRRFTMTAQLGVRF